MSMPVRIEKDLYEAIKAEATIEHRTISGQIEYWIKVARAAIDNPDLPVNFIQEILAADEEPVSWERPFIRREV